MVKGNRNIVENKSNPQKKHTLLKNAQANFASIFLREYFFSNPRRNSNYFFCPPSVF